MVLLGFLIHSSIMILFPGVIHSMGLVLSLRLIHSMYFDTIISADTIISIKHDSFDEVDTFRWRDSFPFHATF